VGKHRSKVRFPIKARNFYPLHSLQTVSGAHQVSCSMSTDGCSPEAKQLDVNFIIHFHLLPRIKMQESMPLVPPVPPWCVAQLSRVVICFMLRDSKYGNVEQLPHWRILQCR
jgi:hypothetical protein